MQSAQMLALTRLTYKYPEVYRQFYLEEKGFTTGSRENSRAQSRAKNRLSLKYHIEYRKLYEQAVNEGCHRTHHGKKVKGGI